MLGRYLDTMTWPEAEAALKAAPLAVLPIGARCKEHGRHLPLNNDWITAEYLARRLLEARPLLALPTVQYGYFPAFVEYPGSVSVARDAFRDTIMDIARSVARHGPRKLYALNNGISTNWALEPARQGLAAEGLLLEYTDLHEVAKAARDSVRTQEAGTHADEIETSIMLYIAPEIVRMELAERDIHPDRGPGPLTRDPSASRGLYSPTGAWGDPTLATREKGRVVVEAMVAELAAFLDRFADPAFRPGPARERYLR